MNLSAEAFRRLDETPDDIFYSVPRLVTHIDDRAIAAVTQLYREYFLPFATILDLMSSWISHLPPEVRYSNVYGLGMNEEELSKNPRLNAYQVQDLNQNPILPYEDNTFDGVGICVSVDYLTQPVAVFKELHRVMKAGAPLVITFSNRCFPTKAIVAWLQLPESGRLQLVGEYFKQSADWTQLEFLNRSPGAGSDPLWAVIGRKS